jgi:hypothetical protein
MDLIACGILLPWLVVALGCWLGFQLLRQNGRLLLRLEALEERLAALPLAPAAANPPARKEPQELPLGAPAPGFELPDLAGARNSLADFRGRTLLLLFFNPGCGYRTRMAFRPSEAPHRRPRPAYP